MTYDEIDQKIITAMRRNSCQRLRKYVAETGIPKSTLHERIRKLCASGVRCVPVIDWAQLGYPLSVLFFVPYQQEILDHPAINTAQHVSPDLLLLECVFCSMRDVEEFKDHLQAARYFTVIEVLKKEGFVP